MILVTGPRGFVGRRIMERLPDAAALPSELSRSADAEGIAAHVEQVHPSAIFHTAAISDIGTCEKDPRASYQANVLLPVALAKAAKATGAKLVAFSSDQVYTGRADGGPFGEDLSLPEPANVYARHKLEAEKRVLDILPQAVMLRATWMYDMPQYGQPNRGNFLVNVLRSALRGERQTYSRREFRGITYVRQVAEFMEQAARLPGGVYNYGSENSLSMYDTALALLRALGLEDKAEALLCETDQQRRNLWMDCARIRQHGICFDTTAEGFARCVADYGLRL